MSKTPWIVGALLAGAATLGTLLVQTKRRHVDQPPRRGRSWRDGVVAADQFGEDEFVVVVGAEVGRLSAGTRPR